MVPVAMTIGGSCGRVVCLSLSFLGSTSCIYVYLVRMKGQPLKSEMKSHAMKVFTMRGSFGMLLSNCSVLNR